MIIFLKITVYSLIFILCTYLGILKSQTYKNRVEALKNFKEGLSIFKTKMKFTYETLPEIFKEISKILQNQVGQVFFEVGTDIEKMPAEEAWQLALNRCPNINETDKNTLARASDIFWEKLI